ncbi:30S ribosomal protein S9 [Plasmodium gonderi]|uniref:30S ribosomal protein S9 n=1 Tax=Plasmodium gonderi TaxID=77519 RepID=A0A1Y1JQH7_PLAGO|nr:30S ribosomal protein S9 [Plasmodium gonderi]GAW83082.1 30S ribosomal protein S9 [Plasmodium gonderi]
MFLYHVNNKIIILILLCTLFYHINIENVNYENCKGISSIKHAKYGKTRRIRRLDVFFWKSKYKKDGKGIRHIILHILTGNNTKLSNFLFLHSRFKAFRYDVAYKNRKNISLFKKKKDKDGTTNVKKKDKKVFTEEEIEELRRKAKEKLQSKKGGKDTKTGRGNAKAKKGTKKKKSYEHSKDDKKTDEEELKKLDETEKRVDEEHGITMDYIKSKEDFDKIVDLTKDLINEKEVEYIHKISDCDEELLTYDKREKHIHLNYEDTIFDEGNYMHNYVNNISKFRFDIYNLHNKNEFDRITKYLNYQYIQEIPVEFPTERAYNIELKKYFYEVVCDLIAKNKHKFENSDYVDKQEEKHEEKYEEREADNVGVEKTSYSILSAQKGGINQNIEEEVHNNTLNNFLKDNEKEEKKASTMDKIENMTNVIQPTDEDIMNKYMSCDLYGLLCDIKEEYDYMFENGGLEKFSFDENRKTHKEKLIFSGKKKRAVATVFLQKGNNNLIINNRDGYQYLQYQILNINKIFSPLLHLCMHRYFNVVAKVIGGGLSGQSVAIFHALVKYIAYNLSLKIKPYFRSFKFMTVDSRKVERKKYGLKKARKNKQYSKR